MITGKLNQMFPRIIIGLIICTSAWHNTYATVSQLDIWDHLKELPHEFSETDRERIIDIDFQKRISEKLVAEYVAEEDREYLERAFNELFTASLALFEIYDLYCRTSRDALPDSYQSELERPVTLERRALDKIEKSAILKKEAAGAGNIETARKIYLVAFDLEQIALLHKARALLIYQDFPEIYSYQWEEDYTILATSPERRIRVIEDPGVGQDLVPIQPGNNDGEKGRIEATPVSRETVAPAAEGQQRGLQPGEGITWIIQIAAHRREITEKEIKGLFGGDNPVRFLVEDNWYKYYLGPYNTYEEAEGTMKTLGLANAFIAAYLNGQRISTGEARRRQASGE
jgi:hypothetical protein